MHRYLTRANRATFALAACLSAWSGLGALSCLDVCPSVSAAHAQAAAEPPPAEKPAAAPAPAKAPEAAPAEAAKPDAESAPDVAPDVGGGMELYGVRDDEVPLGGRLEWARRREIRVIQKRTVLKEGRHGISLAAGVVPNDDFFTYIAGGLGYMYYFSEDFALKVHGAYTYDQKTSLQPGLEKTVPEGPDLTVRLPETLQAYALAGIDWNLLHGKLGFFETRLTEFDIALNFGVGGVATQRTEQGREAKPAFGPAGNVGLGLQFYLSNNWAVRMDYHQLFYAKFEGGVSFPIATTLALTWFTDAPQ